MNEKTHTMDMIFIIGLFILFALSAITVVMIGSKVYSATVDTMESAHNNSTAMNYILEKVSLHNNGEVRVLNKSGHTILCLSDDEGKDYLYVYNHHLYEYISTASFDYKKGQQLLNVDQLNFSIKNSLLTINLSVNGHQQTSYMQLVEGE